MRLVRRVLLPLLALTAAAPAPTYSITGRIAGPDGAGWDYARVDPVLQRLFVAHGDAVAAFDLVNGRALPSIGAIQHGHAVLPIPGTTMLLVTSGRDDSVRLLDARSGHETARIAVGKDPDAAIWDAASHRALVMNAEGGSIAVIDVAVAKVERTIPVKPALEYAALARDGTLFVNDEDANELEVIDLHAGRTAGVVPLGGCEGPTGLAYDQTSDRLIAACANGKAAVVDAKARKLVSLVDIGRGPDAVLLDARRRVALIPCGRDGVLEVLTIAADGTVTRQSAVKTEVGARTGAIDPATGTVYLPTASLGPPATAGGRPVPKSGTFHILVVKPS